MSMVAHEVTQILDVKGLMCPMPLVKARQAVMKLEIGQIVQVVATDKGSIKDFQGWAKASKNVEIIEQSEEDHDGTTLYTHLIKRTK